MILFWYHIISFCAPPHKPKPPRPSKKPIGGRVCAYDNRPARRRQKWGNRYDFPTFAQLGEKARRQEDFFDRLKQRVDSFWNLLFVYLSVFKSSSGMGPFSFSYNLICCTTSCSSSLLIDRPWASDTYFSLLSMSRFIRKVYRGKESFIKSTPQKCVDFIIPNRL